MAQKVAWSNGGKADSTASHVPKNADQVDEQESSSLSKKRQGSSGSSVLRFFEHWFGVEQFNYSTSQREVKVDQRGQTRVAAMGAGTLSAGVTVVRAAKGAAVAGADAAAAGAAAAGAGTAAAGAAVARAGRAGAEAAGAGTAAAGAAVARAGRAGAEVAVNGVAAAGAGTAAAGAAVARAGRAGAGAAVTGVAAVGERTASAGAAVAAAAVDALPDEDDIESLLEDVVEAKVEGGSFYAEEKQMHTHYPIFILVWSFAGLVLWFVGSIIECDSADEGDTSGLCYQGWLRAIAGLETFWPEQTDLRFYQDCNDYRHQLYRFWTYQFTHVGLSHIGMNVIINLMLGVPLNGFHGNLRLIVLYNIGVFGGGCAWSTSDVHSPTVGMSGGCYSLIGLSLSELLMNWHQKKYRKPHLLLLLCLALVETLSYYEGDSPKRSNSAHFGGFIAGMCAGTILGRNLMMKWWEKYFIAVAAIIAAATLGFSIFWIQSHWPPQTMFEGTGWCWIRQAGNVTIFGDTAYHCVRCSTGDCIAAWSKLPYIHKVSKELCITLKGGFAYTNTLPPV